MDGDGRGRLGRRALLATAAGGVAAAAAQALAAPTTVRAANGDPLKIGQSNTGSNETFLDAPSSNGLRTVSAVGDGIQGASAAGGKSGVFGINTHATGNAVWGHNGASGARGGLGAGHRGVYGYGMTAQGVGVRGETEHAGARAVEGLNTATNTYGAFGYGVIGVYGRAPSDLGHLGLTVAGRVMFDRSGVLTIAKNKSSVSTSVPALSADSMVLATLQTNRAGVYIQAAVASPASGKITIHLNKKVTGSTRVAWFVMERPGGFTLL